MPAHAGVCERPRNTRSFLEDPFSISILIEHGGSGSGSAAPIAKKVIKKVLERHSLRESYRDKWENI